MSLTVGGQLLVALEDHVLGPWFPRCVDPGGGFFQSFDRQWRRQPDEFRSAVFQARAAWLSALVAMDSVSPSFHRYALHGRAFLTERFIDPATGAAYDRIELDGRPMDGGVHLAYSNAFVLFALSGIPRMGDSVALEAAQRLFRWIDGSLRDVEEGGYNSSAGGERTKEQNPHLHLLEAITELAVVWPERVVMERLAELVEVFERRMFSPEGTLVVKMTRDWRPLPGPANYGHDLEVAHLLIQARKVLGWDGVAEVSRALIDHSMRVAWDGGFLSGGGEPIDRRKVWWVQFEGLLALVTAYRTFEEDRYLHAAMECWTWIREHLFDEEFKGVYEMVDSNGVVGSGRKGHAWKSVYHDGRTLLFVSRLLEGSRSIA